jgi:hypothetical protein
MSMADALADLISLSPNAGDAFARWKDDGPIVLRFQHPVPFPATHLPLA